MECWVLILVVVLVWSDGGLGGIIAEDEAGRCDEDFENSC